MFWEPRVDAHTPSPHYITVLWLCGLRFSEPPCPTPPRAPPPPNSQLAVLLRKTLSLLVFENLGGRGESREEEVGREGGQERGGGHSLADFASTWQVLSRDSRAPLSDGDTSVDA